MFFKKRIIHIILCIPLCELSGCASTAPQSPAFNPQTPEEILNLPLTVTETGDEADQIDDIDTQARQLLQNSGYPVVESVNDDNGWALHAGVGTPREDTPPPGFTLEIGDPDPRGTQYQKTEIVPVSCTLVNQDTSHMVASYSGKRQAPGARETATTRAARYAHYIRSTCARLLNELDIQRTTVAEASDTFMPGIRIEALDPVTEQALSSDKASTPVSTETVDTNTGRRKIQVFNQGDTLIIELGHQRR